MLTSHILCVGFKILPRHSWEIVSADRILTPVKGQGRPLIVFNPLQATKGEQIDNKKINR